MQRLWSVLTGQSDHWFLTILLSAIAGKLLSILILAIGFFASGEAAISGSLEEYSGTIRRLETGTVVKFLVISPAVESLLLVILVCLLGFKLRLPVAVVVGFSALVFVPLHGLTAASILVLPAFLLWGLIQFNWMARGQGESGFKIVVAAHALANLLSLAAWSWTSSLK